MHYRNNIISLNVPCNVQEGLVYVLIASLTSIRIRTDDTEKNSKPKD